MGFLGVGFLGGCTQKTGGFFGVRTRVSEPCIMTLLYYGWCRFAMSDALAQVYSYELTPSHVPTRNIAKAKYVAIGQNEEQVLFAFR